MANQTTDEPLVLELASLPREQAGPFLLLGLDKAADKEEIESHWADRVRWSRKGQFKVPLEDVNWARNILSEIEGRLRADAASLNLDLTDAVLEQLAQRYGTDDKRDGLRWQPLDNEKSLVDSILPTAVPDAKEIAAAVHLPEIPEELPIAAALLDQLGSTPIDPWSLQLPELE